MIQPFIDAHVHLNTASAVKMEMAEEVGAGFVTINTDVPDFIDIDEQFNVAQKLKEVHPSSIRVITTFSFKGWEDTGWLDRTIAKVKQSTAKGAVGVKIWKNLGMEIRDKDGDFLMIDDSRLDPLFDYFEQERILVLGHQGEPRNCWLPLDEMTVNSDRDYFKKHPEYHMYLHPEYPSYEVQIKARDHRLEKNTGLKFVGLHLFSLEYDIHRIAETLDRFPNSMTDVAERVCHLQLQAQDERDAVRDFMITYQDRIMYGTDVIDEGQIQDLPGHFRDLWKRHWQFFSSADQQTAPEFEGKFKGLDLPMPVLEKFFYLNAKKLYKF